MATVAKSMARNEAGASETLAVLAPGKRRLIEAALRLAAEGRALSDLGLRELSRRAGLNPNTFYRHFGSMEQLGLAAVEVVAHQIQVGLAEVLRGAERHADATVGSARYFFDFVEEYPEPFVVGVRELYGTSPAIRAALRSVLDGMARELADDIRARGAAPVLGERLDRVARAIVYGTFARSVDVVEAPDQRPRVEGEVVELVRMLIAGAAALESR